MHLSKDRVVVAAAAAARGEAQAVGKLFSESKAVDKAAKTDFSGMNLIVFIGEREK